MEKNTGKDAFRPGPDENILMTERGAYKVSHRSGWIITQLYLTDQRLIAFQKPSVRLSVPLDRIISVAVEKLNYAVKTRDTLCLMFQAGSDVKKKARIWFVVDHLESWMTQIYSHSLLAIDETLVRRIARLIDAEGQDILWYLWQHRHAGIESLAELIDAPNHMRVLSIIVETINPVAEKILGCPLLFFEKSKKDPRTREMVVYEWWLLGEAAGKSPGRI